MHWQKNPSLGSYECDKLVSGPGWHHEQADPIRKPTHRNGEVVGEQHPRPSPLCNPPGRWRPWLVQQVQTLRLCATISTNVQLMSLVQQVSQSGTASDVFGHATGIHWAQKTCFRANNQPYQFRRHNRTHVTLREHPNLSDDVFLGRLGAWTCKNIIRDYVPMWNADWQMSGWFIGVSPQIVFDSKLLLSPGAYPGDDIIAGLCFPVLRVGMGQDLSFSIDSKWTNIHSMDWFKGIFTGDHRFSHWIWGFPANFPLNLSIDPYLPAILTLENPWVLIHGHVWKCTKSCGKPLSQ